MPGAAWRVFIFSRTEHLITPALARRRQGVTLRVIITLARLGLPWHYPGYPDQSDHETIGEAYTLLMYIFGAIGFDS